MKARYHEKILNFKKPSGTSRGILKTKKSYLIVLDYENRSGIGECGPLQGLSIDDRPDYEVQLRRVIDRLNSNEEASEILKDLKDWPSISFGLEMALLDAEKGGNRTLFPSPFTSGQEGIPINGLIWMGTREFMTEQIKSLLERGFTCLKMKIGAINFDEELNILRKIRKEFSIEDLILRVDANGAFHPDQALEKLNILSELELHSIEQPIKAGQIEQMAKLCDLTPLDIALDEELIASTPDILSQINPQYIILKPSLLGGFKKSERWINEAEKLNIGWWTTSALESNIGLNAISQWTYQLQPVGHQGLGTGSLYTNNIDSPLEIRGEHIFYSSEGKWDLDGLL